MKILAIVEIVKALWPILSKVNWKKVLGRTKDATEAGIKGHAALDAVGKQLKWESGNNISTVDAETIAQIAYLVQKANK